MTKEERQEIAYILGLIVACLNYSDVPQDELDKLIDAVSKFTLEGVKDDKGVDNPS